MVVEAETAVEVDQAVEVDRAVEVDQGTAASSVQCYTGCIGLWSIAPDNEVSANEEVVYYLASSVCWSQACNC